jgi:hypothetical protein
MFTVVPQYMPASHQSADFLVLFEVLLEDRLVLILELKPPGDLRYASRREAADNQIRDRIRDLSGVSGFKPCRFKLISPSILADDCPLPVLYAVSAIGTKLCFFTKRPGQPVLPQAISADPKYETDTAPRERWNYDILEERFRAMVEEIKQACDAL